MTTKPTTFHSHSRRPFDDEKPVTDAAQRAVAEIAYKYGKGDGAALFKVVAQMPAMPAVLSAVELMRQGSRALAESQLQTQAERIQADVRGRGLPQPAKRSALEDAYIEVANRMRALGIPAK